MTDPAPQPDPQAKPFRFGMKEWAALAVLACVVLAYESLTGGPDVAVEEPEALQTEVASSVEEATEAPAFQPDKPAGKAKAFVAESETLVAYEIEDGPRVRVVVSQEQVVVRSDGGGLTLAGQVEADQVVRLDCDRTGKITGRPAEAKTVQRIVIPDGTVRVIGTAHTQDAVLLLLSDSRIIRGPPIRGVPLPGQLGTLAFDQIRPGMPIADRAAGDVSETCFPSLLVPPDTVEKATVKDFGRTIYSGPVDLGETYRRIALRKRFPHNNDGSVFQNRERRLPAERPGYYREYVHPTEGKRGPGPQRLVIGRAGDIWYTGDHYESFEAVLEP